MARRLEIVADDAVARIEAEIAEREQQLADAWARLEWEQARAEREAAKAWRQEERVRLAKLAEAVDQRVQAAAEAEKAMQTVARAIAAYKSTEGPARALLDLPRENDKLAALRAGEGRLGKRVNALLHEVDLTNLPYHREHAPLQDTERAALSWPVTVDEPDEQEPAAA